MSPLDPSFPTDHSAPAPLRTALIRTVPGRVTEDGAYGSRERQKRGTRSAGHDWSLHGLDRNACTNAAGSGLRPLAAIRETLSGRTPVHASDPAFGYRSGPSAFTMRPCSSSTHATSFSSLRSRQIEWAFASVSQRNVSTDLSRSRCFTYQIKRGLSLCAGPRN